MTPVVTRASRRHTERTILVDAWPVVGSFGEAHLIAIVDDDESVRDATRALLRSVGYRVGTFISAEQYLDSGALGETDCLILDVRMPGISGLDLQRRLKSSDAAVPIIVVSAHADEVNQWQAIEAGAVTFLPKPFEPGSLVAAVRTALTGTQKPTRNSG